LLYLARLAVRAHVDGDNHSRLLLVLRLRGGFDQYL
jgi:hypothetical protein